MLKFINKAAHLLYLDWALLNIPSLICFYNKLWLIVHTKTIAYSSGVRRVMVSTIVGA